MRTHILVNKTHLSPERYAKIQRAKTLYDARVAYLESGIPTHRVVKRIRNNKGDTIAAEFCPINEPKLQEISRIKKFIIKFVNLIKKAPHF